MDFKSLNSPGLIEKIKSGGVGVLPTDTIYGLSALALNKGAVERVYEIKGRSYKKPLIIFIASKKDLNLFEINIDKEIRKILEKVWPGKVSVILPVPMEKYKYLHRGTGTIAFRYIADKPLQELVGKVGPIVSTSANPEGQEFAKTVSEAKKYFGSNVDFYVDKGKQEALPSTLIVIENGRLKVLRLGEVKL